MRRTLNHRGADLSRILVSAPALVAHAAAVTTQAGGARAQADLLHRGDCGAVAPGRQVGEGLLRLREEPELALQDRRQVAGELTLTQTQSLALTLNPTSSPDPNLNPITLILAQP